MNEWISVKDRVPAEGELVIAVVNGIYGKYVKILGWDIEYFSICRTVTHWMPIPDLPR